MNYRHAFHAGNFADVVKHVVLLCLLKRLIEKPKPLCYLETHAGRGVYDLEDERARRTREADNGIRRVAASATEAGPVQDYMRIVRGINKTGELTVYPGSPAIAAAALRPEDRLRLCERHPEEVEILARHFRADRRVSVSPADGYAALGGLLPPTPRRGCALIDPPYESADEVDRVLDAVALGLRRWPTGIFALWYPIKERRDAIAFRRRLAKLGVSVAVLEFCVTPDDNPARLNGSGMAIVSPPWGLETRMRLARDQLSEILCRRRPARAEVVIIAADKQDRDRSSRTSPRRPVRARGHSRP